MSVPNQLPPLVVQSLYVSERGQTTPPHPSVRTSSPVRYLECALAQAASLRLRAARCDLVLATNIAGRLSLGRRASELVERIEALGVQLLPTEFRERPGDGSRTYSSARFGRDAILAAADGQPPERALWLTDLDCIWIDPERVFAAAPNRDEIGCVQISYPPDWAVVGFGEVAVTPRALGELAASMGGPGQPPQWVGGDLLSGTVDALRGLVGECERLDEQLGRERRLLSTEQQVLSLVGALGRARFRDLSAVARRIHTGSRHDAPPTENPTALGLWHLPAEKGLSLRRAATAVRRGRTAGLRRDLADPERAARRFNVTKGGLSHTLRDDGWIAGQRLHAMARSSEGGGR